MGPAPRNRSKPMWQLKEDQDQLEPKEDLWVNEKNKHEHIFSKIKHRRPNKMFD